MTTQAARAGQVSTAAAEVYDEFFVPALFGAWAGPLCKRADVSPGQAVLDVACGTGATTREAARRASPGGRVTGLDRNDGMLSVATSRAGQIDWVSGLAESLPFPDATFDTVLCQFGLMFFEDRVKALGEMRRVVRPGGRVALSVWDRTENSPGYDGMIRLIESMFGTQAADALRSPFILGNLDEFQKALDVGGMQAANVITESGTARFASIREWVRMDVRGWTLADFIDDEGFEALVAAAEGGLGQFAGPDGTVVFPAPAHIAVWERP